MTWKEYLLWGLAIPLISFFALYAHIEERGFRYIDRGNQVERHEGRLSGDVEFVNPWQYRVLSTWAVEGHITAYERIGVANPYYAAFTHFRFLQHLAIFGLCFVYFRRFTRSSLLALVGIVLLGYAMSYSIYDSDLSFDTYTDVIFFLLACIALERGRPGWIIPISALAAANRETAILIPVITAALAVDSWRPFEIDRRQMTIAATAGVVFLCVATGIRIYYGFAENEVLSGLDWLRTNLTDVRTHFFVLGVVNVTWLVPIIFFGRLTPFLKHTFLTLVPIWFVTHYVMVPVHESRYFLVPVAVVLIPSLLHLIDAER